jgi:hypothetical protein
MSRFVLDSFSIRRSGGAKLTHLPGHDQSTSDSCRRVLSGEDRDGRALETHTDTHEKTSDEKLNPGLRDSATDGREDTDDGGEEDGPTATEVVVATVSEVAC